MKLPKITIDWGMERCPQDIYIKKLRQGYLIGDTFVIDAEDAVELIMQCLERPTAEIQAPQYFKALQDKK